jgi:hypothetical protein
MVKIKNTSEDWTLVRNQIFLGVLGSLVVPRQEIQNLLTVLNDAGVRFVYFSPRNMRRQKELASQMGIDVAWNCAISLRPLEAGELDPHRMVSQYADWDRNAKLPHGVEDVRHHLREVDNVPLLVSLYTDVTKDTTADMVSEGFKFKCEASCRLPLFFSDLFKVEIFQEYNDTVMVIGTSHLPQNDRIFSIGDVSVGIDVLRNRDEVHFKTKAQAKDVVAVELEFVCAMASQACAFRFRGPESLVHLSAITEQSRAALDAATSAAIFLVVCSLSFSLFVLFSVCTPATKIPFIPMLGVAVYLQVVIPGIGFLLAMSDGADDIMNCVPPKNDQAAEFGRLEGRALYGSIVCKSLMPAILPQILYLIAFGELVLHFDPAFVRSNCSSTAQTWVDVIRCDALRDYSGAATTSSGALAFGQFALCTILLSSSFVLRYIPLHQQFPWEKNRVWVFGMGVAFAGTIVSVTLAVDNNTGGALPWYFYVLYAVFPALCLWASEFLKKMEAKVALRAEKLRRLQFETRLGAWSPK